MKMFLRYYREQGLNKAVLDDCLGPRFLWKNYTNVNLVIVYDIISSMEIQSVIFCSTY